MPDDVDSLALPYDYGKGESPGAATTPTTPIAAAPVDTSHPELDSLPLPYKPGEAPATTPPSPGLGQKVSDYWNNTILGRDKPPVVLQPRSLSQTGTDIENYGRVAGNQAFIPGSLDVGLAALHGDDVAAENAKSKQAESDIGPEAAAIARFQGQRLSANRIFGEAGVPYANNPIAQGVVTGGGGTVLHGGSWTDAITNAAADTGLSAAGEAVGTLGAKAAKSAFDQSKGALTGAAADLQSLWKRGGDVAGAAEDYAKTATGAAKDAYQKVAAAANQATDTGWAQRGAAGFVGSYLPGGGLATAYVVDPAIKAYNQLVKGVDVSHAIHSLQPDFSSIDPQKWRDAFQSLALSQGPTGSGAANAVRNFSPSSWMPWNH